MIIGERKDRRVTEDCEDFVLFKGRLKAHSLEEKKL